MPSRLGGLSYQEIRKLCITSSEIRRKRFISSICWIVDSLAHPAEDKIISMRRWQNMEFTQRFNSTSPAPSPPLLLGITLYLVSCILSIILFIETKHGIHAEIRQHFASTQPAPAAWYYSLSCILSIFLMETKHGIHAEIHQHLARVSSPPLLLGVSITLYLVSCQFFS